MAEEDQRPTEAGPEPAVFNDDSLDALVASLARIAEEEAARIRREDRTGGVRVVNPFKSELQLSFTEGLRAALEDEVVVAVERDSSHASEIRPLEFQHEVLKKALVGLKLERLRNIARDNELRIGGNREELATRVADFYRWDEEQIARLVLDTDAEPEPERSYVERFFPLEQVPDLEYVRRRLDVVIDRYIRVGVARWFVFETLSADDAEVTLSGTLRAYGADVTEDDDSPRVRAVVRNDRRVSLTLRAGDEMLHVHGGSAIEAKAATEALEVATRVARKGYITPPVAGITSGPAMTFARQSLFMLDLLTTRFDTANLSNKNLTVIRFEIAKKLDEEGSERPELRAVRFEGQHLLDSPPACTLLEAGRPIVDMVLNVQSPPRPDGESARVPVRVAIEDDHVLVMTSLSKSPSLAHDVHRSVLAEVELELGEGVKDPAALMALAARISDRATTTSPVERADMLNPATED
jgi:hypothetical protein